MYAMRHHHHLHGIGIESIDSKGDPDGDGPDPGRVVKEAGKGKGFIVLVGGVKLGWDRTSRE